MQENPEAPSKTALPPVSAALFPPLFGVFGLGLVWRTAASWPVGEVILLVASVLYLFCLGGYVSVVRAAPGKLWATLHQIPGRSGVAAISLSIMVSSAAAHSYSEVAAEILLVTGLCLHVLLSFAVARVLLEGNWDQRKITPVWHLTFVGYIVASVGAFPLGWDGLVLALLILTAPVAAGVIVVSLWQVSRGLMPPVLRPMLAIHLAPFCLFGYAAVGLGMEGLALIMLYMAIAAFLLLILFLRFLTQAGFGPAWGSFTFPLAAFVNLLQQYDGFYLESFAALTLWFATFAILGILGGILRLWLRGALEVPPKPSS